MTIFAIFRLRRHRRGMTLIELVVVIAVLAIVMAIAIPTLRYAFKDRKLREATRELTAVMERTKARAAEIDRPAGIWIEPLGRLESSSRQGVRIFLCEVPPPFTGTSPSATAQVFPRPPQAGDPPGVFYYYVVLSQIDMAILASRVEPGQPLEFSFDHRGPSFTGIRNQNPSSPQETFVMEGPPVLPGFLAGNKRVPFEVHTPPVKTSDQPIELPGDTVIDLAVSGFGATGNELDPGPPIAAGPPRVFDSRPIAVLFSPNGSVSFVIAHGQVVVPPAPIHLLVGRNIGVFYPKRDPSDLMDPGTVDIAAVASNLMDPSTTWVSINHRTAQISTAENADSSSLPLGRTLPQRISIARQIARSGIRMGGR